MEIITYWELEQKGLLLPLLEQAFGWPFEQLEFERFIRVDPRLRDGCVGFCAVKEEKVLGYVGVMDLTTRTGDGAVEKVGGVFAVATLPGYTRQGICTMLLKKAHEYFLGKSYRFSFLTANQTTGAHALYCRLGYSNVDSFNSAYKLKEKAESREASKPKENSMWDFGRMLSLYSKYVEGRTGFVVRDETYLKVLAKHFQISARECITTQRGYVMFKREKKVARVRELIAHDEKEMNRLIGLIEPKGQRIVIGRVPLGDSALGQIYRSRGFTVLEDGHGVLMVKELTAEASFNESYGSRFYMSALDHF